MKYLYIILATIVVLAGAFYLGDQHGKSVMKLKVAAANAKYVALKNEQQEKVDEITRRFTTDIDAIARERDVAIARLRDRPDRVSSTANIVCAGASGANLSRPDAEFLTREAARADRYRNALTACYSYADALQRKN